eukprot:jgi/Mesvir1/16572/Mv25194-RA.1
MFAALRFGREFVDWPMDWTGGSHRNDFPLQRQRLRPALNFRAERCPGESSRRRMSNKLVLVAMLDCCRNPAVSCYDLSVMPLDRHAAAYPSVLVEPLVLYAG